MNQVLTLMKHVESCYDNRQGVALVDLTAAYDTVDHGPPPSLKNIWEN